MGKQACVLAAVLIAILLGVAMPTAHAECGTCWWRADQGTVTGPGHWVCSGGPPYWCEPASDSCIDGDGGCGEEVPPEDPPDN